MYHYIVHSLAVKSDELHTTSRMAAVYEVCIVGLQEDDLNEFNLI
jgi:hypothetical protein